VIRISREHIMRGGDEEVLDTIKHEVAHAIAGYSAKHGPIWQRIAIALGASPKPTTRLSYTHEYKYHLNCGMCKKVVQRRLNKVSRARLIKLYCTNCGVKSIGGITLTMANTQ
jgi:predicted SprT family Zn-dependent metalloprotease